jgi:anaerobic magnesium-protoporphyrin IX monomethyl ester cyclase
MAQVILLYPQTGDKSFGSIVWPLSLLYVAGPLVEKGITVRLIDQRTDPAWEQTLATELSKGEVTCVGISTMTGYQIKAGLKVAHLVRVLAPSLPIVWGGVHPTLLPEQTLAHPMVDIVAIGEGDYTLSDLVPVLRDGGDLASVKGIGFKRMGRSVITEPRERPDLDTLPPLPYHLVDVAKYLPEPLGLNDSGLSLQTSRGCPFRCAYCYNTAAFQRQWRGMSPERVVEQIQLLVGRFGVKSVYLLDDNFFASTTRVRDIIELLKERGLQIAIHNANMRIDFAYRADPPLLQAIRGAGMQKILIGIESGSERMLQIMKKDITRKQVWVASQKIKAAGIFPCYNFLTGIPGETIEDTKETLQLMSQLLENDPNAYTSKLYMFAPYPGTEFYEVARQAGMPMPQRFEEWCGMDFDSVDYVMFTPEELRFFSDMAELSPYLHTKFVAATSPLKIWSREVLARMLRWRFRHRLYQCLVELPLVRWTRKRGN